MIEPEMAFFDLTDNMELAERFLKSVMRDVVDNCAEDMQFFNERIDTSLLATAASVLASDFVRLSYTEAIELLLRAVRRSSFPCPGGVTCRSSTNVT
jgi:asparaginyl-tRNA synthetase